MNRKCSKCKKFKDFDQFYKDRTILYGISYVCKICKIKARRELDFHFKKIFKNSINRIKNHIRYTNKEHTLTWEQWQTFKPHYSKLHNEWEKNNYDFKLTPTIDRINNNIGYTLNNIRVVTKGQNTRHRDCIKLNEYDVMAIKALKKVNPKLKHKALARMFNVCRSNITLILVGKCWTHIKEPKIIIS
jgi:hypothetical protein